VEPGRTWGERPVKQQPKVVVVVVVAVAVAVVAVAVAESVR